MNRLKDLREDVDLKQTELASILNISQRGYSHYERGDNNIPIEFLKKLALFYDTSIDYIVGLTNKKNPYPRIHSVNNSSKFTSSKSLE